jgi:hypothetical protein
MSPAVYEERFVPPLATGRTPDVSAVRLTAELESAPPELEWTIPAPSAVVIVPVNVGLALGASKPSWVWIADVTPER